MPFGNHYISCPNCGAQKLYVCPHGEGVPCPQAVRVVDAQVALLEMQTVTNGFEAYKRRHDQPEPEKPPSTFDRQP